MTSASWNDLLKYDFYHLVPTKLTSRLPVRSPEKMPSGSLRYTPFYFTFTILLSTHVSPTTRLTTFTPLNNNGKPDNKTMGYIQASVRARENKCLAEEAEEKARIALEPCLAVR